MNNHDLHELQRYFVFASWAHVLAVIYICLLVVYVRRCMTRKTRPTKGIIITLVIAANVIICCGAIGYILQQRFDIRDFLPVNKKAAISAVNNKCQQLGIGNVWYAVPKQYQDRRITVVDVIGMKAGSVRSYIYKDNMELGKYTRFRAFRAKVDGLRGEYVVLAGQNSNGWDIFKTKPYWTSDMKYGSYVMIYDHKFLHE